MHRRRTKVETTGATLRLRDFFRLRDQKTSGTMAPVAPPSLARAIVYYLFGKIFPEKIMF